MRKVGLLLAGVFVVLSGCQRERVEMPPAFAELSLDQQHAQLTANIETAKQQLTEKEMYACCIMPTCDWCLLYDKHCGCAKALVQDMPVCVQCGFGWEMGNGNIPGIDPDDVMSGEHEEEHEHEMEHEEA